MRERLSDNWPELMIILGIGISFVALTMQWA